MSDLTSAQRRRVSKIGRDFKRAMEQTGLGMSVSVNGGDYIRITNPKKGKPMPKTRATIDKQTGEIIEDRELLTGDIRELERSIANAYVELESLKEAKDEARQEHQEGQERLNALVGELTRRVNGEQPLPL